MPSHQKNRGLKVPDANLCSEIILFFQAEDGIRDKLVTGVQTCALPIFAKIGKEAQTDTAANRLVWALGYPSEIAYLIPKLKIEGKGEFENVRLEARPKGVDRVGNWMWENNPFQNTPEFRGLKIFMVMINNWDMKDDNNEILAMHNPTTGEAELRYIISDLGGSFGKTGGFFSRSRNEPKDYVKADFIKAVKGDVIDFVYSGKNQKLFEGMTVADARWLSERFKGLRS